MSCFPKNNQCSSMQVNKVVVLANTFCYTVLGPLLGLIRENGFNYYSMASVDSVIGLARLLCMADIESEGRRGIWAQTSSVIREHDGQSRGGGGWGSCLCFFFFQFCVHLVGTKILICQNFI